MNQSENFSHQHGYGCHHVKVPHVGFHSRGAVLPLLGDVLLPIRRSRVGLNVRPLAIHYLTSALGPPWPFNPISFDPVFVSVLEIFTKPDALGTNLIRGLVQVHTPGLIRLIVDCL